MSNYGTSETVIFVQYKYNRIIMNILYRFISSVSLTATVLLAAVSCDKAGNGTGSGDSDGGGTSVPMESPDELVTDIFTAYPSGKNACIDSYLTLTFASAPQMGSSGKIRILDAAGETVDMIDVADIRPSESRPQMTGTTLFNTAMDAIGSSSTGYYRIVYYNPLTISGNTVTVRLHSDKLDYDGEYQVEIEAGAIIADGFDGIAPGEWTFSVMPRPSKDGEVTVGSRDCDFMTVQGAVIFANSCGQSYEMTVSVSAGIYEEQLYIRGKNKLTIKGSGKDETVIRFANSEMMTNGVGQGVTSVPSPGEAVGKTGGRSVVLVENCDMLRFEDLSIINTYGDGSQAETIYFNSEDGRLIAVNCHFSSEQDTIELKGWSYFSGCRITGDVDFIWGYPKAALFEACEICSYDRGYIVQARCGKGDRGFVFLDCDLTSGSGVGNGSVYLARSGGDSRYYDNVSYINCSMSEHIAAAGWYSSPVPNPSSGNVINGWKEYGSTDESGSALDVSSRFESSWQLPASFYEEYYSDAEAVFSDCPYGVSWLAL